MSRKSSYLQTLAEKEAWGRTCSNAAWDCASQLMFDAMSCVLTDPDVMKERTLTIDELHKIRWNMIFNELGIDRNGSEFELEFVKNIHESCIPVDGALDLVKYLSEKYIVCVASNASYNQQKNRLTKAGMFEYFTELFVSREIGFPKPTKEFFDICLSKLSPITKDETIMIGDSLTADIYGGVKYEMKTCWYNHNKEKIPPDLKADFTVSKLSEIKNIL